MRYVIYLIGFLWIAAGVLAILYTDDYKAFLHGLLRRVDRVWLAMAAAVGGLLLLFAASSTTHGWFVGVLGVLGIVKGALIYFNPGGLFEAGRDWMDTISNPGHRLVGILAIVLGTAVISWIR